MNPQILLVGDNRELMIMTSHLLGKYDFDVRFTINIKQAEHIIQEEMPSLVFMDCEISKGNGIDICARWKEKYKDLKIILSSNSVDYEVVAFAAGADDFIKKPYHIDVLIARLKRLCANFDLYNNYDKEQTGRIL